MNARHARIAVVTIAALLAGGAGGYWLALRAALNQEPVPEAADAPSGNSGDRRILYWHDPMVPQQRFDKPGKSPFMDMELQPVYADEADTGSVVVSPRVAQSLGVRTAKAEKGRLKPRLDAVGTIQADENRIEAVQSRTSGWVEKLHVRAVNDPVTKGQLIAEIRSPELLAAQEEYLLLARGADDTLRGAARERLSLLGLDDAQIEALSRQQRPAARFAVHAPASGVVSELGVRQGMQVNPGMNLIRLLDLSAVWMLAEVPESRIGAVRQGAGAEVSLAAYADEKFRGRVDYIYPQVDAETRTIRVRVALRNPGQKLRPGMLAQAVFSSTAGPEAVLVPEEAVIHTGRRSVVIVAEGAGHFRALEVEPGAQDGGMAEILHGLDAGTEVVVSGQFLIDSEASLKSALGRLESAGEAMPGRVHQAVGVVRKVDMALGELTIQHEPVASLDWPAMTMDFGVADRALLSGLAQGRRIEFDFTQAGDAYVVSRIAVLP
jgi:Cu(I)/Ag(I) efflux system membrane fusion protein